jgi:thiazole synthase
MELGADAVLVNTAIAVANDPVIMAKAFKMAVESGYLGRKAGYGSVSDYAIATSPSENFG